MRIYVHRPGTTEVDVIDDVQDPTTIASLIEIGEGDIAFIDEDSEPVDIKLSVVDLLRSRDKDHGHHHHIHHHGCREITVAVVYGGVSKLVLARPNTTLGTVLAEAIDRFDIDRVTGADLVLRLPGADADLLASGHVGELVDRGCCDLELNLLPAHREAG